MERGIIKSVTLILFLFCANWLIYGCPIGGSIALSTGKGWSTDVVIHKGVIHTARYNYSDMTIEYAYKSLTEDIWHKEVVEKFERFYKGEKAYKIGGVDYGGFLRMAVNDEAIYIAYAGMEPGGGDGVLPNMSEYSIKLAKRFDDGKWYVREITTESISIADLRILNNTVYILSFSDGIHIKDDNTLYVNGPLADACVQTLKNEGNFKITGKLSVGTLQGEGTIEYDELEKGVVCEEVLPPSVEDFIKGQRVIWFGSGWVEEYDENGNLVRKIEGKFYQDPSGAQWLYRNDGSWGMKGDTPSRLEWYTLVFENDFRNPAKNLDVYDGGIYVMGKMKDSGNLVVRDKPDEFSVVVLGDGFFTSDIDITGKVYIAW